MPSKGLTRLSTFAKLLPMTNRHAHIGEAIKARRDALELTQEELCARMGWKASRISEISAIENGDRPNIGIRRLALFASALDCSLSDLVFMLNAKEVAA